MTARRDLQAGTVASPIGGPQTALIANNTNIVIVQSNLSRFSGRNTENQTFDLVRPIKIPTGQVRSQPNQEGTQAPVFPVLVPDNQTIIQNTFTKGKGNVLGQ